MEENLNLQHSLHIACINGSRLICSFDPVVVVTAPSLHRQERVDVFVEPWKMPLTAQFQPSLDYHTLSVLPRNETQRKCSIFVNIDCVFSRLYCALFFVFI